MHLQTWDKYQYRWALVIRWTHFMAVSLSKEICLLAFLPTYVVSLIPSTCSSPSKATISEKASRQ